MSASHKRLVVLPLVLMLKEILPAEWAVGLRSTRDGSSRSHEVGEAGIPGNMGVASLCGSAAVSGASLSTAGRTQTQNVNASSMQMQMALSRW